MALVDDFEAIIFTYNRVEEREFLRSVEDFAEKHKEVVIRSYFTLLRQVSISLQLKYLALKSIGELKYREFLPLLQDVLNRDNKIRIIYSAVEALVRINTLGAYKVLVHYLRDKPGSDAQPFVEENLKELFNRNHLIYHFDVFYRSRGHALGIEKSSEYLINHLSDEYIKEILPCIACKHYNIRYETLRILKNRPNALYCAPIYNLFKEQHQQADEPMFRLLCETLVLNASLSRAANRYYNSLKQHLDELQGKKNILLSLVLLKLNTAGMIPTVSQLYPRLNFHEKEMMFENINREEYEHFLDFMRDLLTGEDREELLKRVMEILIYAVDFPFIFNLLERERKLRRETLFEILMDFDPPAIEGYVHQYIDPNQSTRVLYLCMQYLMRHAADDHFDMVKSIFFSGVHNEVKTLIIRYVNRFSPGNQRLFMQQVFDDLKVIRHFKKDFLYSLVGLLNEKVFDQQLEHRIIERVLVLMEEANFDEIIHFIYFFEKYHLEDKDLLELISEELRLIQNTILKSSNKDEMVRLLHMLVKNMEKRFALRGVKPTPQG